MTGTPAGSVQPRDDVRIHAAPLTDIPSRTLYRILRLRVDVFVVEQEAAYDDLDGRDDEPGALMLWAEDADGEVLATARVLRETDAMRIGRVATAPAARGAGIAGVLLRRAIVLCGDAPIVLGAQAHLEGYYGRFGFVVDGPGYEEDAIPHVPMRRAAPPA